ncbi:hypothetical protein SERLA73DRAFT_90856 [Serpula lacrymans var. lacrymans S7.3]|uniref:intramembrane prenyl-peptidase Rce1 n=2 Tax=Serpula lacrymans var. lacrymans TaxID=341189 RepID=F8Q093_SERL3|nr:uncharacterized protein SERLADRAFT_469174 [Serpula lacrymans var. lacrymans S7.9]EGN97760.1 hypothetical protein SERLA73DRAFT_90856 [Serpula lacrymans var. lacrymans S7.3]EGO23351.1 hypothetical protein SERLADRAFT_469174 [Serpula lacrymans var. lacrymans S7.9]
MPIVLTSLPQVSAGLAHIFTTLLSSCYVGSIYASKEARLQFSSNNLRIQAGHIRNKERDERWRDDPDVIRARLVAVSLATLTCCMIIFCLFWYLVGGEAKFISLAIRETLTHLGLRFNDVSIYPYLVTPLLFLGPLYALFLSESLPFQRSWSFNKDVFPIFFSVKGLRNYIIAPITEEVVFRACILTVYHLSHATRNKMIFLSPLSFGAAHLHHAWDTYNRYGRSSAALKRAVVSTLFQFTYTSIFGFYCSYLFIRTSSVFPPIVAHIFCNIMGVPQPGFEIRQSPNRKWPIVFAYLAGIVAFTFTLGPWTHMEGSLYWK